MPEPVWRPSLPGPAGRTATLWSLIGVLALLATALTPNPATAQTANVDIRVTVDLTQGAPDFDDLVFRGDCVLNSAVSVSAADLADGVDQRPLADTSDRALCFIELATVPAGWRVASPFEQYIDARPLSGGVLEFHLEPIGPSGALIIDVGMQAPGDAPGLPRVAWTCGADARTGTVGLGGDFRLIEFLPLTAQPDVYVKLRRIENHPAGTICVASITAGDGWYVSGGSRVRVRLNKTAVVRFTARYAPNREFVCNGKLATIVGTQARDNLTGTTKADVIFADTGDDRVAARGGADTVCGGDGDDRLLGGAGTDFVSGGRGADDINGGRGPDTLIGGAGIDMADGGPGPTPPPDACTAESVFRCS